MLPSLLARQRRCISGIILAFDPDQGGDNLRVDATNAQASSPDRIMGHQVILSTGLDDDEAWLESEERVYEVFDTVVSLRSRVTNPQGFVSSYTLRVCPGSNTFVATEDGDTGNPVSTAH